MTFEENKHPRDDDGKFTSKGNEGNKDSASEKQGGKTYRQNTSYEEIQAKKRPLEDKYNTEAVEEPANKKKPKEKNILEDLPESAITEAENFIKEKGWGKEMKNMMFGRMASDLNNYFGFGGRSNSVLWAKDLKEHLAIMQALNPTAYKEEVKKYRMLVGEKEKREIKNQVQ